jgi:hypothetical protein
LFPVLKGINVHAQVARGLGLAEGMPPAPGFDALCDGHGRPIRNLRMRVKAGLFCEEGAQFYGAEINSDLDIFHGTGANWTNNEFRANPCARYQALSLTVFHSRQGIEPCVKVVCRSITPLCSNFEPFECDLMWIAY